MQHRARSGTQALNYIWTTDDILAGALSRFVRVSSAGRRFGSNVPGPLEARRRGAKRRMGMVPSMSDVGNTNLALGLGLFAWSRVPKETPSPQWTPPDPPRTRPQEVEQSHVNEFRTIKDDSAETETPADRIDRSVQTFQGLLNAIDTEEVTADDLRSALDYLEGAENVGEAQNTLRLLRWMSAQKVHATVYEALEKIILRKIRSQNMARDELSALMDYWTSKSRARYPGHISLIHAILDELDSSDLKRVVWTNTCRLAKLPPSGGLAPRPLTQWMTVLSSCASLQGQHADSIVWNGIYRHLSARFTPKELQLYLGRLDQLNLARILLKHWVPRISQEPEWLDTGSTWAWRMNNSPRVQRKELQADYDSLPAGPDSLALGRLVSLLAQYQIPQHNLASEIFEIISRMWDPNAVVEYIQSLATNREVFVPMIPGSGSKIVNYLVRVDTEVSLKLAMDFAEHYTSIPLSTIPDLFPALVRRGYHDGDWTRRMFVLLCRKAPGDTVKMSDRIKSKLRLTKQMVLSVHRMAKAFAEVRDLKPRVAFRRVWQCYRFLHDRGAPTNRSLSQAFVQAGLVNFLEAGQHIPTTQAKYILSIVEVHDGPKKADEMDRLLWTVMRENWSPQHELAAERKGEIASPVDFRSRMWKAGNARWLQDRRKLNKQQVDRENGHSPDNPEKALGTCDDSTPEHRNPIIASRRRAPSRAAANPKAPAETSQSHQSKEAGAGEIVSVPRPFQALTDRQLPHAQVVDTLTPAMKATTSTAKPSNPFLPSPLSTMREGPSGQTASVKKAKLQAWSTTDSLDDADSLKTLLKKYANESQPNASQTVWREPPDHSANDADANRSDPWVEFDLAWAEERRKSQAKSGKVLSRTPTM